MIDPEVLLRARRRQNRFLVVTSIVVLALGSLPLVMVLILDWRSRPDGGNSSPLVLALTAIPLLVTLLVWGGLLLARRRGARWLQPAPIWGVDRVTRRRIAKAVRAGEHLSGEDEQMALDLAHRLSRLPWLLLPLIAVAGIQVVRLVTDDVGDASVLLRMLSVVGMLVSGALAWRDARRGRRYLRTTGAAGARER